MFPASCSKANSGVCTPTTVNPARAYAAFQASTWGSVRWQLMHEYVQKSIRTTRPFSPATVSGRPPGVWSHREMPANGGACPHRSRTGLSGVHADRAPPVACPVTPASACLAALLASIRFCRAPVYPGTARCRPSVQWRAKIRAVAKRRTPMTLRTTAAWVRTDRIRVATYRPARANNSRGMATPTANAPVRSTADQPIWCWAPTSAMAASTGPAQGTKTRPRLRPSTNPPPSVTSRPAVIRAKGRSSRSPTGGTRSPRPSTASTLIPVHRSRLDGRPKALSNHEPASTVTEKLRTRPATTAKGRRRRRAAASRVWAEAPTSGAPAPAPTGDSSMTGSPPVPPPTVTGDRWATDAGTVAGVAPTSASSRPLAAPEAKITGSTGRMHGEMPVIFASGAASGLDEAEVGATPATVPASVAHRSPVTVGGGTGGEPVIEESPVGAGAGAPDVGASAQTLLAAARRRRRPFAVVAGLVLSFSVTVLAGSWLLSAFGLPSSLLRWTGISVLAVLGLGLLVPPVGD